MGSEQTQRTKPLNLGGVVLCGGESRRMGQSKAWLPWKGTTLVQHTVSTVAKVADCVVVVAGPNQALPAMDESISVLRDPVELRGPLQGMEVGFSELQSRGCDAALLVSCDLPNLSTEILELLRDQLEQHDAVIPHDSKHLHPLLALYRTASASDIQALLAQERRRPKFLIDQLDSKILDWPFLQSRGISPDVFCNINTPDEYQEAGGRPEDLNG